jgi:hypothetical protein
MPQCYAIHTLPVLLPLHYALLLETQLRLEEYSEFGIKLINLPFPCFSFYLNLLYGAINFGFVII